MIFVCATRVLKLLLSGRAGEAVPWKRAYVRFIFHTLLATIYENFFSGPPLRKSWVRPCMLPMECWNPFTRAPSAVSGLGLCILHHHIPDVPTPVVGYRGAWILFFAHGTWRGQKKYQASYSCLIDIACVRRLCQKNFYRIEFISATGIHISVISEKHAFFLANTDLQRICITKGFVTCGFPSKFATASRQEFIFHSIYFESQIKSPLYNAWSIGRFLPADMHLRRFSRQSELHDVQLFMLFWFTSESTHGWNN